MLKIKSEQIRTFQADADEAFDRRVMEYLRENHAGEEVQYPNGKTTVAETSDEILAENVRGGILRARGYGIEWKSTLISYVVLMLLTAPNFDQHQKAAQFFQNTEKITDEELESFLDEMTDEDWQQVEENYDAAAWMLPLERGAGK